MNINDIEKLIKYLDLDDIERLISTMNVVSREYCFFNMVSAKLIYTMNGRAILLLMEDIPGESGNVLLVERSVHTPAFSKNRNYSRAKDFFNDTEHGEYFFRYRIQRDVPGD